MTAGEVLSLVIGVTALLGTVLVFITNSRANRTSEKKLTVEEQAVRDDREATVAQQRLEELNRLHPRLDALEKLCDELKDRLESAEKQINASEQQTLEMISHIVVLEGLVPDPPGPPTRPNWKLPILTDRTQGATS